MLVDVERLHEALAAIGASRQALEHLYDY